MTAELDERPTGRSDEVWASVVRSSHDAIVTANAAFEIIAWNPAAERLYGYPPQDIIGRSLDVIIPPERRRDQREIFSLLSAGVEIAHFRTRRVHRDGHAIPVSVSVSVSPLTDRAGHIVGLTSVTRRLSDRECLEASFQALLEAAPDAVIGVADDGQVVLSNTQADQLFGVARNGLIGRAAGTLVSPGLFDAGESAGYHADDARGTQPVAHRSDGTTIPVEITVAAIEIEHGRMRCAVIRDITERLRAQNEYLRMRTEADHARVEAQLQRTRRLESLGQLAGGVAHDFNNIIAVIVNYAGFIGEEAAAAGLADVASDAEQINRAGQRGAELTRQLLAFARREIVRPRAFNLNELVIEVEQMLCRAIGEHITLTTRLTDAATTVTADPGQIEQVLVNLAVNARDAMPRGGHLSIDTDVIDVDTDYSTNQPMLQIGRYVRLRVSDTGTGMPREVIDRAFEPFFTTKPAGQGTGLGLATVYGIITTAGGDLTIYSEDGMGTTMNVLLPAANDTPADTTGTAAPEQPVGGGETVLAVEDEPALRHVTRRILTAAGYQVLTAENGPAALTVAEQHTGPIDLLLTDVVMPHMLGKELAERLQTTRPDTTVLFMSGYAQPVLTSQGTLDPDVTLLEKPFTRPQLLTAVSRILGHRR